MGNHTRQVQRLHQWFVHWTNKLQNEQSKKIESKKRKRPLDDDGDGDDISEYSRETFQEDSSKNHSIQKIFETVDNQLIFSFQSFVDRSNDWHDNQPKRIRRDWFDKV